MKRIIISLITGVLLSACTENVEKLAERHLENAREAFVMANYNLAKTEIDSIRILYPKAFEARRQGIKLMQQVEEAEQLRTIEYEDSIIEVTEKALERIKADYVFEKDSEYQDLGLYTIKSQSPTSNLDRTYIRGQVDELGRMTLISHYCGSYYIHHDQLRLESNGSYVETPVCKERHEFTDLGVNYERLSLVHEADGGAAAFISANSNSKITYTLYRQTDSGERRPVYRNLRLTDNDCRAIAKLYDLSQLLISLQEHKSARDEAERHLAFIRSKMNAKE